jgi:DNA-binding LacI/PurR family transcriptional regulator
MRDVSNRAGVSQSTVSRVLSGGGSPAAVAPDTRERVLRAAKALGYRPHPLARALRGGSTALVGVIAREIADPFNAALISAVAFEARRSEYNVVLGDARRASERPLTLGSVLEVRHCQAIIVVGDLEEEPQLLADLRAARVPIVGVCQRAPMPGMSCVASDDRHGAYAALDYLHDLGHRRIAFVGSGQHTEPEPRHAAYCGFVEQRRLPCPSQYHEVATDQPSSSLAALDRLFRLPAPPTAVLAATDLVALGLLTAAEGAGLRVPGDLSVVGFGGLPLAGYATPALTTVRRPVEALARLAIKLALGPPQATASIQRLMPELVVRESCSPPRGENVSVEPALEVARR